MAILVGTTVADTLQGEAGDDLIIGLGGDDRLIGESPNGSAFGNDTIIGGAGDDLLDGAGLETSSEVDILIGGEGEDTFSLQDDGDVYDSLSVIVDFEFFIDFSDGVLEIVSDQISLPGVGSTAFVDRFEFQDGDFEGLDGAFLVRTGPSVAGEQVAFFVGYEQGFLNFLFGSVFSPII